MTSPSSVPSAPIGELIAGKYRIERQLGQGGMGVVMLATHIELGQFVALKFLKLKQTSASLGEEALARFLREARAAVRLKSEHVARILDVGKQVNGEPFIVMEYLEGDDLSKYAKKRGQFPIGEAVEFVLQTCEAVVEAHALGIIHRDLKPQNLFLTRRLNGAPLVKVLDFGISKTIGEQRDISLTESSAVLGSPLYMSPEQMRAAKSADARSDVWSLGVILYEFLTGEVPFDGDTLTELCLKVAQDTPAPPQTKRADLPPELAAIVMRCLEKDPNARFANAAAFAEALEPFAASAGRGTERVWRSLADTTDSLAPPAVNAPQNPSGPHPVHANTPSPSGSKPVVMETGSNFGTTKGPSSRGRFWTGLGAGVAIAFVIGGTFVIGGRMHNTTAESPRPLAAAPPQVAVTSPAPSEAPAVDWAKLPQDQAPASSAASSAHTAPKEVPAGKRVKRTKQGEGTPSATGTSANGSPILD